MARGGSVYIITNKYHTVFYTGVSAFVRERIDEHREKINLKSFTSRYNAYKLVYYEDFHSIEEG